MKSTKVSTVKHNGDTLMMMVVVVTTINMKREGNLQNVSLLVNLKFYLCSVKYYAVKVCGA